MIVSLGTRIRKLHESFNYHFSFSGTKIILMTNIDWPLL